MIISEKRSTCRALDTVLVLVILTSLAAVLVSGDEFRSQLIVEPERRYLRVSRGTKKSVNVSVSRRKRHRAIHKSRTGADEYVEEHHIIIDDGSSLNLPAEHRGISESPTPPSEARVSQGGGRPSFCGWNKAGGPDQPGGGGNQRAINQADECDHQKTIETAVFIDQALDNKFSGLSNGLVELNKLVLTIMNQVQQMFMYSSLKVPIRIKLVLVEHMRDSERQGIAAPNPERGDIDAYLSNFCNWQQSRLERDRRIWWDTAILLSGLVACATRKALLLLLFLSSSSSLIDATNISSNF